MSFLEFASQMFPYWICAWIMMFVIWNSDHKDILRFDKKAFSTWVKYVVFATVLRVVLVEMFYTPEQIMEATEMGEMMPIGVAATVFWEDILHTIPLVLFARYLKVNKWTFPIHALLMLFMMFDFGSGHMYQGLSSAMILSLYIPATYYLGKKHGFGTIMMGHMFYDFATILLAQNLWRFA